MSPHRWTTPAQLIFLENKQADYLAYKARGLGANEFYRTLFDEFFKRWPEQANENTERALLPIAYNKKKKPKKLAVIRMYENHTAWRDAREKVCPIIFYNAPYSYW